MSSQLKRWTLSQHYPVKVRAPKAYTGKDEVIAKRLFNMFEEDLMQSSVQGVHFYVHNGTVTLYGFVRHELDRQLLLEIIRDVQGVKKVIEHLKLGDGR